MANYNFGKDLPVGEIGEESVKKFLTENYGASFIGKSEGKELKYWDIKFKFPNKSEVTYEVKNDVFIVPEKKLPNGFVARGFDTGNIFIEFESRGKDTGINVTKADWWVNTFYYLNEIWFIKVSDLKKLIKENDFKQTEQSGDDGSNTRGYLIPRKQFKEKFIVKKFQ